MHIFYCSCHPIRPPLPRLSHSIVCQVERKVKHAPLPELWEWKTQKLQNCSPGQSHILRCWISHDFHDLISILWWCKTQKEEQRGIKAVGNFHNNFQSAAQKILIFRGGEDLCKHNYIPSSWGEWEYDPRPIISSIFALLFIFFSLREAHVTRRRL